MQLLIKRMRIQNFKGVKAQTIEFSPVHTDISGANGSGKTTIPDAFSWVLYNKDSLGNAPGSDNFREKPLDDNGQEIHGLETSVEIEALVDGARFDIKRIQAENWVKKRGAEESVYSGNVSSYYINDVETKQADFKKRISELVPDDVSRFVSTLSAFNATEWKTRRNILIGMSGVDVDAQLVSRDEFSEIGAFTANNNVSVEEMKKIFSDRKRFIEQDLKMIPVRIDEASKALSEISPAEIEEAGKERNSIQGQIVDIEAEIIKLKADDPRAVRVARMDALHKEKDRLIGQITSDHQEANARVRAKLEDAENRLKAVGIQFEHLTASGASYQRQIEDSIKVLDGFRDEYKAEFAKSFVFAGESDCPTCGQALTDAIIAERSAKAEAAFNEGKAKALEAINGKGRAEKERLESAKNALQKITEEIDALTDKKGDALLVVDQVKGEYEAITQIDLQTRIDGDSELAKIEDELLSLAGEPVDATLHEAIKGLEEKKKTLQDRLFEIGAMFQAVKANESTVKRIEALRDELSGAGHKLNDAERMIALIEKFIQERCGLLEESINRHFPTVRWKLFGTQINGGLTETCQCMIPCLSGLVPYESANTAAQIAGDVEIANVLGQYFNARLPLFVDNVERLNIIPQTDTQLISLRVTSEPGLKITHH